MNEMRPPTDLSDRGARAVGIENNKVERSETKSEPTTIECEKDNKNRGGDGETLPLFVRPSVLPPPSPGVRAAPKREACNFEQSLPARLRYGGNIEG